MLCTLNDAVKFLLLTSGHRHKIDWLWRRQTRDQPESLLKAKRRDWKLNKVFYLEFVLIEQEYEAGLQILLFDLVKFIVKAEH